MARASVILSVSLVLSALLGACDPSSSSPAGLKGQSNAEMTFYGLAVDELGNPLEGVAFELSIESIPVNWSFDNRGKPHDVTHVHVTTDANGRFHQQMTLHILRVEPEVPAGFRHFCNRWGQGEGGVYNRGYQITAWGDVWYQSNPANPAIYVFVRDGAREVTALPSRGGTQIRGKRLDLNKPGWPPDPSIRDVVYKPPTTAPSTPSSMQPSTKPD